MQISVDNNNVKHPKKSLYLGSCTLPSTSCLSLPREEGRCWECWWTPTTPGAPSWYCPLSTKTLLTLRPLHDLHRHQKPCPWPSSPWKPGTGCWLWGSQRRTSWCWSHRVFGRTDYSLLHRRPQPPRASSAVSFLPSFTISLNLEAMQRSSNLQTIWKENISGKNINAIKQHYCLLSSPAPHKNIEESQIARGSLVEGGLFYSFLKWGGLEDLV